MSEELIQKVPWYKKIWNLIVKFIKSLFGKVNTKVTQQSDKVRSIQTLISEALAALKTNDVETAKSKLEQVSVIIKEILEKGKVVIDKVKDVTEKISK